MNWGLGNNIVLDVWKGAGWDSQRNKFDWQWQQETLRTDFVVRDDKIKVSHFSVGR